MKKSFWIPLITALMVFAAAYLLTSWAPGMRLKLAADPWTYFVRNTLHMAGFKLLVSAGAAVIAGAIVHFAGKAGKM